MPDHGKHHEMQKTYGIKRPSKIFRLASEPLIY